MAVLIREAMVHGYVQIFENNNANRFKAGEVPAGFRFPSESAAQPTAPLQISPHHTPQPSPRTLIPHTPRSQIIRGEIGARISPQGSPSRLPRVSPSHFPQRSKSDSSPELVPEGSRSSQRRPVHLRKQVDISPAKSIHFPFLYTARP
jgi:hypothetical protein